MQKWFLVSLILCCVSAVAKCDQGFLVKCDVSGTQVITAGINSTTKVEGSFPGCTVTVFVHGSATLATIFSDNGITPLSNPFNTPSSGLTPGQQVVYSNNGRFDFVISGAGISSPITISDVLLNDFANTSPLGFCTVTFSATPTFNSTSCNIFLITLAGNVTSSTYTGVTTGQQAIFLIQQDNAGSHTFTWPSTMIDTPAINQSANTFTNLYFVADNTPKFHLVSGGGGVLIGTSIVNGAGSVSIPSSGSSTIQANSTTMIASTCAANQFGNQITSGGVFNCAAVLTALTASSHQFFNAVSAAGVFSAAQPSLSDVSAGTAGTGTYDFSGTTIFKLRVGSGLTTSVNGDCGIDSTTGNIHCFSASADRIVTQVPVSSTPTNTNCVKWSVGGGGLVGLLDNGGPCAVTISSVSHNFLTSYTSTTGVFTQAQPAFTDISGTVAAAQLPNPTSSTLGGIQSFASVSHQFVTQVSTSGVISAAQPAPGDISGAINGDCIIGSGSAWVAGSCAGTAGEQVVGGGMNITGVSVSTATTANQTLQVACLSGPCFGAGALNTTNKLARLTAWGTVASVNTTETVNIGLSVFGTNITPISFIPVTTSSMSWRITLVCSTVSTGASGSVSCQSDSYVKQNSSGAGPFSYQANQDGTILVSNIDLTGSWTPTWFINFGTASSSNQCTQARAMSEQLN